MITETKQGIKLLDYFSEHTAHVWILSTPWGKVRCELSEGEFDIYVPTDNGERLVYSLTLEDGKEWCDGSSLPFLDIFHFCYSHM